MGIGPGRFAAEMVMWWSVLGYLAGVRDRVVVWSRRWEQMIHGWHFIVDAESEHDERCNERKSQRYNFAC